MQLYFNTGICRNYAFFVMISTNLKVSVNSYFKTIENVAITPSHFLISCTSVPKTVQHLCAKRFRSVQNYPKPLRKERWESSAKAKASAQESPENRGKNSPVNLHCLKPSNSPSKCIETHQWIRRMRFVRRTAEIPTYARSVPQPGCRRLTNHQLLLNWRKSKTNSPGSIPRSSHLTLRQQPLRHDDTQLVS
uniref:Secreted protein n=1 Tax=Heterorhabditis bacteriophora TaxID=37862 RepID=A0A1I7WKL0_HETBA